MDVGAQTRAPHHGRLPYRQPITTPLPWWLLRLAAA